MANLNSHWLANEDESFSLDDVPDLEGKIAVVTGGLYHPAMSCPCEVTKVTGLLTYDSVHQDPRASVMAVLTHC